MTNAATNAATFLEVTLGEPSEEEIFIRWWAEAERLLEARHGSEWTHLHVLRRGHYLAAVGFVAPGAWKRVERDRRWQELVAELPAADIHIRHARAWTPHDLTTAELQRWVEERFLGKRDFVFVDALPEESFRAAHLPGAVNLPPEFDEEQAAALLGPKDQVVIVYCAGYGCGAGLKVGSRLAELGWSHVFEYPGGLAEWRDAGGPIEAAVEETTPASP